MKNVEKTTKADVIKYLKCLEKDFEMLRNGDWVPDDDSIDASLTVVQAVIDFVEEV